MNQAAESTEMFLTALIFEGSSELCLSHLFRFWCVCCVFQDSWEEKRNHCCGESCWLRAGGPGGADAKFGAGGLDLWEMDLRPIQSGYEPESQEELKTGAIALLLFCVLPANHGLPSAPQAVTMESCVNGDWQTGWGIFGVILGWQTLGGSFQGQWSFSALIYTLAILGEGRWASEEGPLFIPRSGTLSGSTGCQLPLILAVVVGIRHIHEHPRWAGASPTGSLPHAHPLSSPFTVVPHSPSAGLSPEVHRAKCLWP